MLLENGADLNFKGQPGSIEYTTPYTAVSKKDIVRRGRLTRVAYSIYSVLGYSVVGLTEFTRPFVA